ncbi:MAG: signal peptidase I [Terriglobia bacterium]|nr:signal peptidase I [Terriglobia bacterium]
MISGDQPNQEAQPQPHVAAPAAPALKPRNGMLRWLRDVIISAAVSVFIIVFVYQPVKVEGTSMMPGLVDQERIFINKFIYRWEPIERGDVVVFRYPQDPSKSYIKRVIGTAGDRVRIEEGRVYVNDRLLNEPYVRPSYRDDRSFPEITVPADSFFVLGDHRNMSQDSRDFGSIPQESVYGKAVFVYWPFDKLGKLH